MSTNNSLEIKDNQNQSPFTSKGYPFRKEWSSYTTYNMGRTFFSDGYVDRVHGFEVFDHVNVFNNPFLKDQTLYYKKEEIPVTVYTTNTIGELSDKYNKLEIDYNEIAVFFCKQNNKTTAKINLGDSLLKLSHLKDENEMENKLWTFTDDDIQKLSSNLSAKNVVSFFNKENALFSENVENISGLYNIVLNGYWSKDKEGKIKITNTNLGEVVYFQLSSVGLKDNTKIVLQLQENDGYFFKPSTKFLTTDKNKKTSYQEINKNIYIKNGKAIVSLYLDELWADMIDKDLGNEIELEWMAYGDKFQKKVISNELNVGFSKRHLFLIPAFENYNLPEILTEQGETIVFSIGDFLSDEIEKQLVENTGKQLENYRYFLGARILKSGKVAANTGEIYTRKKAIYNYNIYTNEGKEIRLVKASNFGFKNKYVNNGKLVTTKGISQIDYFTNIGLKNNVLKAATELTEIWDIFDLAKVFFQDDFNEIPTGYLANPVSFAYALLNEFVIKPTTQGIIDDFKKGLAEDFETIYKPKGLQACKSFVDNKNVKIGFRYLEIFTPTLQKLLKNEFLSLDEMDNYNKNIEENEHIKTGNQNVVTHTIFYKAEKNKYGLNDDVLINCIFINNKFLNE